MKKDTEKKNGKGDGSKETVVGSSPNDAAANSNDEPAKVQTDDESAQDVQTEDAGSEREEAGNNQAAYPSEEFFSYVGSDSTAMSEIFITDVSSDGDEEIEAAEEWRQSIFKPESQTEESLQQGVAIAKNLAAEANRVLNLAQKSHAERARAIGIVCRNLKRLLKRVHPDVLWDAWATENLPFIGVRNRQKYMRIAKRTDSAPYDFLGVERLDMLIAASDDLKRQKYKDPIGTLLEKYDIPFDEKSEMEVGEFKKRIDAAIAAERLEEKGLKVDFQLVQDVVNVNGKIDRALISRLQDLQKFGGDATGPLNELVLNGGKKQGAESEQRSLDFNKLSADLIKTIDYLIEEPDYIEKLDGGIFDELMKRLQKLRKLRQTDTTTAKAA
jgi:hypothetical protein